MAYLRSRDNLKARLYDRLYVIERILSAHVNKILYKTIFPVMFSVLPKNANRLQETIVAMTIGRPISIHKPKKNHGCSEKARKKQKNTKNW
jgi:hypothetical protein